MGYIEEIRNILGLEYSNINKSFFSKITKEEKERVKELEYNFFLSKSRSYEEDLFFCNDTIVLERKMVKING